MNRLASLLLIAICVVAANAQQREDPPWLKEFVNKPHRVKNNLSIEVMNHATGHHGFDIEDYNARSREILKRTIEFLRGVE